LFVTTPTDFMKPLQPGHEASIHGQRRTHCALSLELGA